MVIIDDIVREMRGPFYRAGRSNARLDKATMQLMSSLADRIEKACMDHTVCRLQTKPEPTARWLTVGEPCHSLEEAEILMNARRMLEACGSKLEHRVVRRIETEWEVCSD